MRHEETFQSARSRQHRSRIVDKQIDFFLLIVSIGQSLASQGEPGAPRASKASQPERPGHPDRAIRGQIEPARASQKRPGPPNRASQGAQGRDAASQDAPGHSAGRPAGRASPSWTGPVEQFRYGYHIAGCCCFKGLCRHDFLYLSSNFSETVQFSISE